MVKPSKKFIELLDEQVKLHFILLQKLDKQGKKELNRLLKVLVEIREDKVENDLEL